MADLKLLHGIYESVINNSLEKNLSLLEDKYNISMGRIDTEESSFSLALHLTKLIANSLAGIKGDNDQEKQRKQAKFCNQLLEVIGENDSV